MRAKVRNAAKSKHSGHKPRYLRILRLRETSGPVGPLNNYVELSGRMPTLQIMTNTDWLTLALVVITGFYAWATLKILRANEAMVSTMRDQQNAAMRPYILVSTNLRMGTQLLYLSIKNVGKTAALNLKLSLDKSFYQLGEKREERNIANSAAFSRTIDSLPPDGQTP